MVLKDKVAIITGAARGIGQGIALRLGKEGAIIVCADMRPCDNTIAQIKEEGGKAVYKETNLRKWEDIEGLIDFTVKEFGRIDILVNNAGVTTRLPIDKEPIENWDFIQEVNLRAVWMLSKAVVPIMKNQNFGRIVNISSITGVVGQANHAVYGAAKGGVVNMTRCLALELVKNGITVNCVNPMTVPTELFNDQGNPLVGEHLERVLREIPIGKLSAPADIAGAVNFFVGPDASYVTGQILSVDGGYTCG